MIDVGAQVGPYRLERVIGQGGMGCVYEALHPVSGNRVAVKIIAAEHAADHDLVQRFFAEARAVSKIHHENIVKVLDLVALADGRPAIVMELIDGRTLRHLVTTPTAPLGGIVEVVVEVLDVLDATHAVGVVHRDLKPDNILVTRSGNVKVVDFGVAKLAAGHPGQPPPRTRTGAILGTPEYMAPEQISGSGVDARTDVYAVGIVLFEAVTGQRPFDAPSDFLVMRAHLEEAPPSASALRRDVPASLAAVIAKALEKAPERRYRSAGEMAAALVEAAAALPANAWRSIVTGRAIAPTVLPAHLAHAPRTVATRVERPRSRAPAPAAAPSRPRRILFVGAALGLAGGVATYAIAQRATRTDAATSAGPSPARVTATSAGPAPARVAAAPPRVTVDAAIVPAPDARAAAPDARPTISPALGGDRFDPSAFLAEAEWYARDFEADAELSRLDFRRVAADGTIENRRLQDRVTIEFVSPSIRAGTPRFAGRTRPCLIGIIAKGDEVKVDQYLVEDCDVRTSGPLPRCTLAEVWQRAEQRGADTSRLAHISWRPGAWLFEGASTVRLPVPDDCR